MPSKMEFQRQKKALIFRLFAFDPRVIGFLFESAEEIHLRDRPERLIEDIWELEDEQRILVRAALDIWSGSGQVFLTEILKLKEPTFTRLIVAIQQTRQPRKP